MLYDFPCNLQYQEYLKRYNFAQKFVMGKVVLDIGCGPRPGSKFLAKMAKRVVAIDISREAIEYAKSNYKGKNLEYYVMDATKLKFPDESFEVVTSLEVLEHIKNYRKYLSEIKRVLRPEGIYVFSTPNREMMMDLNPAHIKEFSFGELKDLLKEYFEEIDLYGQFRGKGVWGISKAIMLFLRKYDIFNLRKIFSTKFKGQVSRFLGKMTGVKKDEEIVSSDIEISKKKIEGAKYFIGTCKKYV